jgi:hypothetical protein
MEIDSPMFESSNLWRRQDGAPWSGVAKNKQKINVNQTQKMGGKIGE